MPDEDLRTGILALLPEDGTPVLNRVMRVMLARRFERSVDDEVFFAARDKLFDAGKVGRLRGQGGQIFLTQPDLAPPASKKQAEAPVKAAAAVALAEAAVEGVAAL